MPPYVRKLGLVREPEQQVVVEGLLQRTSEADGQMLGRRRGQQPPCAIGRKLQDLPERIVSSGPFLFIADQAFDLAFVLRDEIPIDMKKPVRRAALPPPAGG